MILAVFGEENMPFPTSITKRTAAKIGYQKS